jgi:hypothetical protein
LLSSQIEYLQKNLNIRKTSRFTTGRTKSRLEHGVGYLEEGKRRCDKNLGTFPVFRMSLYGKFLMITIFHKPICPLSSGVFPSDDSFESVCSSTNITKQTFSLEYSLICSKQKYSKSLKGNKACIIT